MSEKLSSKQDEIAKQLYTAHFNNSMNVELQDNHFSNMMFEKIMDDEERTTAEYKNRKQRRQADEKSMSVSLGLAHASVGQQIIRSDYDKNIDASIDHYYENQDAYVEQARQEAENQSVEIKLPQPKT